MRIKWRSVLFITAFIFAPVFMISVFLVTKTKDPVWMLMFIVGDCVIVFALLAVGLFAGNSQGKDPDEIEWKKDRGLPKDAIFLGMIIIGGILSCFISMLALLNLHRLPQRAVEVFQSIGYLVYEYEYRHVVEITPQEALTAGILMISFFAFLGISCFVYVKFFKGKIIGPDGD